MAQNGAGHTAERIDDIRAARALERVTMVRDQLVRRGIRSRAVLDAIAEVPRELFLDEPVREYAYEDSALPIAMGQTISQPYIVALMTELAQVGPGARVLEVGTGSGYQAAVLAQLGADVYTIEIHAPLMERALSTLNALGYHVHARVGDGHAGWPEAAPFDAILITAAPRELPRALVEQLKVGGRLVVPIGREDQTLYVIRRTEDGFAEEPVTRVRFVPLVAG